MRTLYEKRGRRYIPVSSYDPLTMDAMPQGAHLVVVDPGVKSTRYSVDPDRAAVLAVLGQHRDQLARLIREASEAKPTKPQAAQRMKAWEAYKALLADDDPLLILSRKSAMDIVDALERAILERAK